MTSDPPRALRRQLGLTREQRGKEAPRKTDSAPRVGVAESATPKRRPNGANYIRDICLAGPGPLTTCLWVNGPAPDDDPIWGLFRRASLRTSDRELRRREARAALLSSDDRERLAALRWEWLQQLLANVKPGVTKRLVFARGPCGVCLRVEKTVAGRVVVVAERTVDYEERMLDNNSSPVQWMSLDRLNAATLELLHAHFPVAEMMSLSAGNGWRTGREPRGWPIVTRVIAQLYDYMVPFYGRAYRRRLRGPGWLKRLRRQRTATGLPETLACDIMDIVRHELPHLAGNLTARSVRGVVYRYIKILKKHHAALGRPLDEEMFHDRLDAVRKPYTSRDLPRQSLGKPTP